MIERLISSLGACRPLDQRVLSVVGPPAARSSNTNGLTRSALPVTFAILLVWATPVSAQNYWCSDQVRASSQGYGSCTVVPVPDAVVNKYLAALDGSLIHPLASPECWDLLAMAVQYGTPTFVDNVVPLGSGFFDPITGEYGLEINGVMQADLAAILGMAIHEMAHSYFGPGSESIAAQFQTECFEDHAPYTPDPGNGPFILAPAAFTISRREDDQ